MFARIAFLFLLSSLVNQNAHGPINPNSRFLHEQLRFGSRYESVVRFLLAKNRSVDEQSQNPFIRKEASTFLIAYTDTVFEKRVGISLTFSKEDSGLKSINLIFLAMDPKTRKPVVNGENAIESLWDSLSTHWGAPRTDKSIPLIAKKREWSLPSAEIQMTWLMSGSSILTVTYSSPR
jgi:hypothetical protein